MKICSRYYVEKIIAAAILFAFPINISASVKFAAPEPNDLAKNIVEQIKYNTLEQMRAAGLEQAHTSMYPWSGWYWPLNEGGLAYRYADPAFPSGEKWPIISDYLLKTIGTGKISDLSPSEKYDLLLGDANFGLTRAMIQLAGDHAVNGTIEAWVGYCTGWAIASSMMPRPARSMVVTAADGITKIEFRPSDIKALSALLWANGSFPASIVGAVCKENPVRRDPITSRPLNINCRDTNPATFHLLITNQIGAAGRALLMDSDSGYQIWNHPISNYSYTYYNPATEQPAPMESARITINDFTNDLFKGLRAPGTKYVVGVETKVTFVYTTRPNTQSTDSPAADEVRLPVYKYDLELDGAGRIIGGEWRTRLHPDVLWVTRPGTNPKTIGDSLVNPEDKWNPELKLPESWIFAAKTSVNRMQPLGVIVQKLFDWTSE